MTASRIASHIVCSRPTMGAAAGRGLRELLVRAKGSLSRTSYPGAFIARKISSAICGTADTAERAREMARLCRMAAVEEKPQHVRCIARGPPARSASRSDSREESLSGTLISAAAGENKPQSVSRSRHFQPRRHLRLLSDHRVTCRNSSSIVVGALRAVDHDLLRNDGLFTVQQKRLFGRRCHSSPKRLGTVARAEFPERRIPWRAVARRAPGLAEISQPFMTSCRKPFSSSRSR